MLTPQQIAAIKLSAQQGLAIHGLPPNLAQVLKNQLALVKHIEELDHMASDAGAHIDDDEDDDRVELDDGMGGQGDMFGGY